MDNTNKDSGENATRSTPQLSIDTNLNNHDGIDKNNHHHTTTDLGNSAHSSINGSDYNNDNDNNNNNNTQHDLLSSSIGSLSNLQISTINSSSTTSNTNTNTFTTTPSKYDDYSEDQLQEFAQIVSPKVSELLKEQALALDDLLLESGAWMNNSSGSSEDDGDSDDDSTDMLRRELNQVKIKSKDNTKHGRGGHSHKKKKKKQLQFQKRQENIYSYLNDQDDDDEDEDGMDEEWRRLNAAEMELRNELELATNGFASLMQFDNHYYGGDNDAGEGTQVEEEDDEEYYDETVGFVNGNGGKANDGNFDGGRVGSHPISSLSDQDDSLFNNNGIPHQDQRRKEEQSLNISSQNGIHRIKPPRQTQQPQQQQEQQDQQDQQPQRQETLQQHQNPTDVSDAANFVQVPPSKLKLSYSLADHAVTLDVSRPAAGIYTRPLLSRHDLETLGLVTLPNWITRPGQADGEEINNNSCPASPVRSLSNNNSIGQFANTSRGRENFMKRVLSCTQDYIEPPKSKTLRKLFSGWNPGPGERRMEDNGGGGRGVGGDDTQRVMAYSPSDTIEDGDSSNEENEDNDEPNFIDVDGVPYPTSSPSQKRLKEPRPVRTVTIRVRPDVLCGAVMDALTVTVVRLGGTINKRQGGHLRAICPGAKTRVWAPGEWEREMQQRMQEQQEKAASTNDTSGTRGDNAGSAGEEFVMVQDGNNEDESSVASGLSSFLSLTSPVKRRSSLSRPRGPKFVSLPPYLVDAQLVTKKLGKECQRVLLIRVFRVEDVASIVSASGEEEEILDIPTPLDKDATGGGYTVNGTSLGSDGRRIDKEAESERSLKDLREAAALVQRIKAVGSDGFAIDVPPPMMDLMEEQSVISKSQPQQSAGYLKSFSDVFTSPIKYFSGNDPGANEPTSSDDPERSGQSTPTKQRQPTVMEMMTKELTRKYQHSPSVGTKSRSGLAAAKAKSHGLFPALSKEDSPYVKASWMFVRECIEEMDRRCLTYSSLGTSPLFEFPALPTLDAHFISQIKSFCRESMIVSLVKTASELEIYAREFELSCNNLDQLLKPTFHMYRLNPPALPTPLPLTAYPLDFQAPEVVSPPWGPEVKKVLDSFADDNGQTDANAVSPNQSLQRSPSRQIMSSFERAEDAMSRTLFAFQRQNDVEQGARLGRKNMQVMDRLAKMQAHKRNCITALSDSYGSNLLATKAADEFHAYLRKCPNVGSSSGIFKATSHQVPLLICNVMVGNATGTCYVTDSHILFVTQLVPILGGNRVVLFSIMDVELTIQPPSKSMLSPLPASISLTVATSGKKSAREEVYNFIPSIGARRFAKFLEVVKDCATEDPNTLKFSERGGLIYMYDGSN